MKTSADTITSISKTVTLLVNDTPRAFQLKVSGTTNLWEGKAFHRTIRVDNPDFPKGPFKLYAQGTSGPITVEEDKTDPTKRKAATDELRQVLGQEELNAYVASAKLKSDVKILQDRIEKKQ